MRRNTLCMRMGTMPIWMESYPLVRSFHRRFDEPLITLLLGEAYLPNNQELNLDHYLRNRLGTLHELHLIKWACPHGQRRFRNPLKIYAGTYVPALWPCGILIRHTRTDLWDLSLQCVHYRYFTRPNLRVSVPLNLATRYAYLCYSTYIK